MNNLTKLKEIRSKSKVVQAKKGTQPKALKNVRYLF